MNDADLDIDARIVALEAHAPGRDDPPRLTPARRRGRFAVSLTIAPLLVLALVATAAAGAVVVGNLAEGHEGLENPGQPLAGANLECMSPPAAAAYLAARGYVDVVWQVESGSMTDGAGGKGPSSSITQTTAPEHGYVVPGYIGSRGQIHMVVDQRIGATGVGACFGTPMP